MYPLGFHICPSCGVCGNNIFVVGYDESTLIHKKRKCIYKRDEYFRSKIGKFSCRELLRIPDRVMRLLEGELHNSDNILYCYSQVDSLTIPTLEELLKKNKLMRYKCDIYNLYFTLNKKHLHNSLSRNVRKPSCILNSYINYIRNIYQTIGKAFFHIISFCIRYY